MSNGFSFRLFGGRNAPASLDAPTVEWMAESLNRDVVAESLRTEIRMNNNWESIDLPWEFWTAVADSAIETLTLPLLRDLAGRSEDP